MSSSQRLAQTGSEILDKGKSEAAEKADSGEKKEKMLMWLFLAVSMVLIYFSMSPNSKV